MWKPHTVCSGSGRGDAPVSRTTHREVCVAYRPPSSACIRASVGGWVLKSEMQSRARKGLNDEHVRGGGVGVERHAVGDRVDLAQRIGQPVRVAGDARRRRRRPRTPANARWPSESSSPPSARKSSSPAARSDCCRRRDRRAPPAEQAREHRHPRHHHDRRGNGRGDRTDQDVAMLDVRKLVRDDAFQLVRRSAPA